MTPEKIEELRQKISSKKLDVHSDNPMVERTKIVTDAIKVLADDKNEIFSQLDKAGIFTGRKFIDETFNFALTYSFAENPMEDLEQYLESRGIFEEISSFEEGEEVKEKRAIRIDIPVLKEFATEWLRRRHLVNRSRVKEYIQALDAGSVKELARAQMEPRQPLGLNGRIG